MSATNYYRSIRKTEAQEISAHNIISAGSILKRFKYIFEPLLYRAKDNYRELSTKIETYLKGYKDIDANYYTFLKLESSPTAYYSEISSLWGQLNKLEKDWTLDIGGNIYNPNSGHHGTSYSEICAWATDNPLHLCHGPGGKEIYKAAGKVRPYDFVAAYNFKGYLESLYSIAAEMRNIAFRVFVNGVYSRQYSVGKSSRYESYKDMQTYITGSGNTDKITDISIIPSIHIPNTSGINSDDNKSKIYNFTDFIINNTTNGKRVFTPDEIDNWAEISNNSLSIKHGYVGTIPLYTDEISSSLLSNSHYKNTNIEVRSNDNDSEFGRQTVNHLKKDNIRPSTALASYYNFPSRFTNGNDAVSKFDYTSQPSNGIVYQYIRLKPANKFIPDTQITNWREISDDLDDASFFVQNQISNIVSKTNRFHKKHKITAKAVNDMFKYLNTMAAKISATLCGEYTIQLDLGPVIRDSPPKGGLGYPEFFSWYFGTTESPTYLNGVPWCDYLNGEWSSDITKFRNTEMRDRVGQLSNGNQIASEDYTTMPGGGRNLPIRAGMFYLGKCLNAQGQEVSAVSTKELRNIAKISHSSLVPMTFNKYSITQSISGIRTGGTIDGGSGDTFKAQIQANVSNCFPSAGVVFINNAVEPIVKNQIFNRYCLCEPYDTKTFFTKDLKPKSSLKQAPATYNVNTKYIFMPYMCYLHNMAKDEQIIYNGRYKYRSNLLKTSRITSAPNRINNAAGIPVSYEDRNKLWVSSEITSNPTSLSDYKCIAGDNKFGTIQLQLYQVSKSVEGETITTSKVYTNITSNPTLDWFEYQLSAVATINEVNHTHDGTAHTECIVNGISKYNTSTEYEKGSATAWSDKYSIEPFKINNNDTKLVSSFICIGANSYVKPTGSEISDCLLDSAVGDMMHVLYGNRFKFNDFYESYHPLSNNRLQKEDIASFFTPGGSNDYVEGNNTKVMSYTFRIPVSVTPPTFKFNHWITQETGESEGSDNLAQGGFFFGGNYSTKLQANNQIYEYDVIPQPDPISADLISGNSGKFYFTGYCRHFWNEISSINLYFKYGTTNKTFTIFNEDSNFGFYPPINHWYRDTMPRTEYYLKLNGTRVGKVKLEETDVNGYKNSYKIDISTALNFVTKANDPSCALRFFNENGGFRDVCKPKNTTNISDGLIPFFTNP